MTTQYTTAQQRAIQNSMQLAQQSTQAGYEALANATPLNQQDFSTSRPYTDQERQDLIDYGRFLSAGVDSTQGRRGDVIGDSYYMNLAANASAGHPVPTVMNPADINMSNWAGGVNWMNGVGMGQPVLSQAQYLALRGPSTPSAAASPAAPASPAADARIPTPAEIANPGGTQPAQPAPGGTYQQYVAQPAAIPPAADMISQLATWTPTLGSIDPATETVQGQMQGLLAANSPYMELARQNALATANGRGLLNTSIAAGAGEKAAIESALPIANADAQLYMQQSMANQNAQNQAGQFNTAEQNALVKAQYQTMLQDILNQNNVQYDMEKMSFDEGIKTRLTALQQDYAVELETLKQSYNIQQNRDTQMAVMYQDSMKSIATFLNRAELTPEQQSSGVKVIIDNLNAGLQFMAGIGAPSANVTYNTPTSSYKPPVG
jgi:hypothetical protein